MAQANISINVEGKSLNIGGEMPDTVALEIFKQVTDLVLVVPVSPTAPTSPAINPEVS